MTNYIYGLCSVCSEQILDNEEPHIDLYGEDCHERCCPVCHPKLVCCACGAPATAQIEVVRFGFNSEYTSVCTACVAKHTVHCIDLHNLAQKYRRDWPDYCRSCNGWGCHIQPQTYWEPEDVSPCVCIEDGRCPRCAYPHGEDWEGETCEACGWQYDDGGGGFDEPECECGLSDDRYYEDEPFSYNVSDHDY